MKGARGEARSHRLTPRNLGWVPSIVIFLIELGQQNHVRLLDGWTIAAIALAMAYGAYLLTWWWKRHRDGDDDVPQRPNPKKPKKGSNAGVKGKKVTQQADQITNIGKQVNNPAPEGGPTMFDLDEGSHLDFEDARQEIQAGADLSAGTGAATFLIAPLKQSTGSRAHTKSYRVIPILRWRPHD
jgi:hypothetical protein